MKNTKLAYLKNANIFAYASEVIDAGEADEGPFVVLGETIWHPKGGGQPDDIGHLSCTGMNLKIDVVRSVNGQLGHFLGDAISPKTLIGKTAAVHINPERRRLNSGLHTVGHLLAQVVIERLERYEYKVVGVSHSSNGRAYIEFMTKRGRLHLKHLVRDVQSAASLERIAARSVQVRMNDTKEISRAATYMDQSLTTRGNRTVTIDGFRPILCDGTHLTSLRQITGIHSLKTRSNGNRFRLYYGCAIEPVRSY